MAERRGFGRAKIPSDVRRARVTRHELLHLMADAVEETLPQDSDEYEDLEIGEVSEPFSDFIARQNPSLLDYEHVPRQAEVVDRMIAGEHDRVLVIEPPRYFKTEHWSRLLAAYFLRQFPKLHVGLASYGASLAWNISEEARAYYVADGGKLAKDTRAKRLWATDKGGEMWAAGTGGPMLGFGYHLGIIDDPVDPQKADSPTWQRRFREWYPGKFLSRAEPGALHVFVMQRLGQLDPVDFLLKREVGHPGPPQIEKAPAFWHVVFLDEIKSEEPIAEYDGPQGLPETCTLEPDPRDVGEVLAPSRFTPDEVERKQRDAGPYVNAAQRQGRPMEPSGDFWKKKWFQRRIYTELPEKAYDGGKDWDTAYTKNEANAATAWLESYRGPGEEGEFPIYIHDLDWDWLEFPEQVEWMKMIKGPHYVEAKATGKSNVQVLAREGITASEVTVQGDKFARAAGAQPVVAQGRVWVRDAVYDSLLLGERQGLLRVTAEQLQSDGAGLDVNDVFVQAIARHVGGLANRVWFR